ncbi:hypothetical protein Cabys_1147 [Caldithrix abyssi DSM 13497]|uniref:Uncharacterized protein n=1 Tax=Caldithrix abyssi DSM 13497 TaxID=880073 RepID=A0A1J1C7L2_CALAY|nr:hypothetical protein Cabys_1147 [Caldithrix abyssi DSM 13497]
MTLKGKVNSRLPNEYFNFHGGNQKNFRRGLSNHRAHSTQRAEKSQRAQRVF